MATIASHYIPFEILEKIVNYTIGSVKATGRGIDVVRDLSLVSRAWQQATYLQLAQVPQKKRRENGNGKIVRVAVGGGKQRGTALGGAGVDAREEGGVEELGEPVWENEVILKGGPLKVGEVIIWHDLTHAIQCLRLNRARRLLWQSTRAIFLSVVKTAGSYPGRDLNLAHHVFAVLHEIFVDLRNSGIKPRLEWLRLALFVWQGFEDMDAPGMFYLSRLHGIPFVRFHCPISKALSCYISKPIREVILTRTRRVNLYGWMPTGLENPCPRGDWQVQALRKRRRGELENDCLLRFLIQKYEFKYKM